MQVAELSVSEKLEKLTKLENTIFNTISDFDSNKIGNLTIKDLQVLMMLVQDHKVKLKNKERIKIGIDN